MTVPGNLPPAPPYLVSSGFLHTCFPLDFIRIGSHILFLFLSVLETQYPLWPYLPLSCSSG